MPAKRTLPDAHCEHCGLLFRKQKKTTRFCSETCYKANRAPISRPCQKCGKNTTSRFYCSLKCANHDRSVGPKTRYRQAGLSHRRVMEAAIGRPLRSDEYVHHADENTINNALENLIVMTPAEHGRHHHLRHPLSKKCAICGTTFTPHKTKRKRAVTCGSQECVAATRTITYRRGLAACRQ